MVAAGSPKISPQMKFPGSLRKLGTSWNLERGKKINLSSFWVLLVRIPLLVSASIATMPLESELGIQLTEGEGSSASDGDIAFIRRGFGEVQAVRQGLYQRHLQMIALAGTIGTGLFLSSGQALVMGGPLGAFLAYTIVGLGVSSVVLTVGEMGALVPLSGGLVRYAEYFFDPAMAFANGWNQK